MASAPSGMDPVTGRVDREGRLTRADPALLRLQEDAGSMLGAPLALPQLAAVVRSAMKLGVPLSRSVIAASADQDLDLWVRAEPDEEGATLTIEGWKARPPAPPRLTLVGSEPAEAESGADGTAMTLRTDAEMRLVSIGEALAARLSIDPAEAAGQPLTRYFMLMDGDDGMMPLLTAIGSRQDFEDQVARVRGGDDEQRVALAGSAIQTGGGKFAGYEIQVSLEGGGASDAVGMFDPALDEALRSPLDRIIAAADRIVDRSEGPLRSDYAAYAGDIAAAGRHLLSVIRTMTEQEALKSSRVDLSQSVNEAVQLVQARAAERSIAIEVVGTDRPMVATGESRGTVQISSTCWATPFATPRRTAMSR